MLSGPNIQDCPSEYSEKRVYLQQHFPQWFIDSEFSAQGFLAWANTQTSSERNKWLRELTIDEMTQVLNHYHIWSTIFFARHSQSHKMLRANLTQFLPFWLEDDKFDRIGFDAWYQRANFMDKEIVFPLLTLEEQKPILQQWALRNELQKSRPPCEDGDTLSYKHFSPTKGRTVSK
ncbi:hypothetical protein [Candidatus Berkiella aquae]|uniref:Uncharacterized protein n=1 Tax=Candidatus Berkiella aquae TaxID=295108 RepID=A0A0Q9YNZ0_9GAMM|nr:hypothetical protein [Candidatus Berkiella aquae]MCS5712143.1 hypothetical protein [Candidatus Berkiella aquae]